MFVRRKLVAGAAVLGLAAGASLIAPSPVDAGSGGAEPVTVTLTCLGADPATQGLLDLIGSLQSPPIPAPVSLPVTATVTADVPANASTGESVPVSFESELELSETLVNAAVGFGITQIDISNLVLEVEATGGGEGGPYAAAPNSFTINLVPPSAPTLNAGGVATITDETEPTLFEVLGPVTFSATVSLLGNPTTLNLTCEVPEGTYVASINGELPPPPSTTTTTAAPAPTTTATAPPAQRAAVAQTPRFTG